MGVLWGTYAADMPDIKVMLGVSEARLGLLMLMTPIAAMAAMLVTPWVSRVLGRVALPLSALAMAFAFAWPGQFASVWLFPLAMLACGATTGATDVLMNARASALEARHRMPLMNLCHAAYSFGYAGGALGTGVLRAQGLPPSVVMPVMALLAAGLILWAFEAEGRIEGLSRPPGARISLGAVPLVGGGIVLIAFLTENAAEYWSALHVEQTLGGSPAFGSAAPALLALTMGVSRLAGQGLAQRVGSVRLMLMGATLSALGALAVAAATSPALAYAGFVVMGMGSSVISPTAFTLIGQLSPAASRTRAVAQATFLGYAGYFVGPPVVGFIAGSFGLPGAFVFAAAMLMLIWVLAPQLRHRS